jgi:pectin methylesterase-like acyl-CoA thioesterase
MKRVIALVMAATLVSGISGTSIIVKADQTSAITTGVQADASSVDEVYKYDKSAANITMTEQNDTILNSNKVTVAGSADQAGTVIIKLNGKVIVDSAVKAANEQFTQDVELINGRNSIDIIHKSDSGKIAHKSINMTYLTSYDILVDSNYAGKEGVLDANGIKTFKTLQMAVNAVPSTNNKPVTIFVKNGSYKQKVIIDKPFINLIGEDSNNTVLTYDAAEGTRRTDGLPGSYGLDCASVTVTKDAVNFTATNIKFENSFDRNDPQFTFSDKQALAIRVDADKSSFYNCSFTGDQDTLYAGAYDSRQYYSRCYIEGDVDFIFGQAQAVFDDCDIRSMDRKSNPNGFVTAPRTAPDKAGYLFLNCRLFKESPAMAAASVNLGRCWGQDAETVYVNCYLGDQIGTKGWDDMSGNLAAKARFYEYGSYGDGAVTSATRRVLTDEQTKIYTMDRTFSQGYSDLWTPAKYFNVEPVINVINEPQENVTTPDFDFTASIQENANVTIKLNGQVLLNNKVCNANEAFTQRLSFNEGKNNLEVQVVDSSKNQVNKVYNVNYNKAVSDATFNVSNLSLKDVYGNQIEAIKQGSTIYASVNVQNNSKVDQTGTVVIALYDSNDNMVDYSFVTDNYGAAASKVVSTGFNVPTADGYKVKSFIWNNISNKSLVSNICEK